MYFVKDLVKQCDVTGDAVRYYTRLGLLKPERNQDNDYKLYNKTDLQRLNFIHRAKHLGFSLSEIAKIFEDCEKGESPCPRVREIIQRRIVENREKLRQAMELQERMEQALVQWTDMPDGVPDGDTICSLIESFGAGCH